MESAFIPWKKYLNYAVLGLILIFVYSYVTSPMVITSTGVGEVTAKPETATITFTLASKSDNPQKAISDVKDTANKIRETLKTSGVTEGDIYESQATVVPAATISAGESGFQSTIAMGMRTKQINNLDAFTSQLYGQGALIVSQPILSLSDSEKLESEAYKLAVKDAKKKAGVIALSNFKLFKKIILIEQSNQGIQSTVTTKPGTAEQVEKKLSPDDGLIKISKVVSVSYKMW